jgi:transcriptional regulator with XRE-family HTH domain
VKVSRYESGNRTPSLETGLTYEAALGVPVCTLFRGKCEEIAERVTKRRRKLEAEKEKRQRVGTVSHHAA